MADHDSVDNSSSGGGGGGFGTMGGGAGDGLLVVGTTTGTGDPQPPRPPSGHAYQGTPPPSASGNNNNSALYQQQPQQQPSPAGSITRFAPVVEQQQNQQQSYAARSQQAYGTAAQQQQQQQQPYGGGYGASTTMPQQQPQQPQQQGGYAARSQQLYGGASPGNSTPQQQQQQPSYPYGGGTPQQQQQQPTPQPSPYGQQQPRISSGGGAVTASALSSYGGGPPQPQPQLQQSSYAARSQPAYGPPTVAASVNSSSSSNVYTPPAPPPPSSQSAAAGSYASRSAAVLYGQQQQSQPAVSASPYQQQQQQQPQQQQPGYAAASSSQQQTPTVVSSANATSYAGMPPQAHQQQQQQQSMMNPQYQQQYQQQQYPHPHSNKPLGAPPPVGIESAQQQQRLLTEATRKVQEHAYYMKQAMEQRSLPVVLDRAAHMVGELGGPPHGQQNVPAPVNTGGSAKLNPKNYYELYMRALEDMPAVEDYLLNLAQPKDGDNPNQQQQPPPDNGMIRIVDNTAQHHPARGAVVPNYTMRQLYDCVQYCPRVVSRLYLQIAAGAALLRSGECGAAWVLRDLQNAVKCEQNPVRGLFLRHFLLTALRDHLPDAPPPHAGAPSRNLATIESKGELEGDDNADDDDSAAHYDDQIKSKDAIEESDPGTVKDSYEFVLANFMEMNKLWVRIQHLPGEGKNKDVRKRRERERNDLRILVGTNLVRLSQLECVTSKIYGEVILSQILDHIVTTGDPLSQAYLMDCLVQVFPDEYHIETMPILLNVCPRLRDKVNIRTILQGLMDRLANYLAEEELLDEDDTNQVKKALARDSFGLFDECVEKVYNARGPKLTSKEVIRLQTALLQFSIKCYPGHMEQVSRCVSVCVTGLRQANASYEAFEPGTTMAQPPIKALDDASVVELEKLLSIPLDTLAMKVLELEQYSVLIGFLPWVNRREVAMTMLKAMESVGTTPRSVQEIEQLFNVIEPLVKDDSSSNYYGADPQKVQEENARVSKLVHLLDHDDASTLLEMLQVARTHICASNSPLRVGATLTSVVFAAVKLARRVFEADQGIGTTEVKGEESKQPETKTEAETAPAESTEKPEEGASAATPNEETKTEADVPSEASEAVPEGPGTSEDSPAPPPEEGKPEPSVDTKALLDSLTGGQETTEEENANEPAVAVPPPKKLSCRKVFVFIQETIVTLSRYSPEKEIKLYLDMSLAADTFAKLAKDGSDETDFAPISYELLTQAFALYEEQPSEEKAQYRCVNAMCGTLLALNSISKEDYERLITKTAQFSAKILKKPDQCKLVALCAHLFYPVGNGGEMKYSNPQRALECLQRSLKLADACTSMNPSHLNLFVDLLEHYLFFFEKRNELITHAYITGLIALIKEHINNLTSLSGDAEATKAQYLAVLRYIKQKKNDPESSELFAPVQTGD